MKSRIEHCVVIRVNNAEHSRSLAVVAVADKNAAQRESGSGQSERAVCASPLSLSLFLALADSLHSRIIRRVLFQLFVLFARAPTTPAAVLFLRLRLQFRPFLLRSLLVLILLLPLRRR